MSMIEFLSPVTSHQYVAGVCAIIGLLIVGGTTIGTAGFVPMFSGLLCFWIFTYINVSCLTAPGIECNVWGWLTLIQPICLTLCIVFAAGLVGSVVSATATVPTVPTVPKKEIKEDV